MRILVVESDESMRNLLLKFLLREGFEVDIATNNYEASEMLRKGKYGVVIIDENTYKLNDFDIRKLIQEIMPDVKVIYIAPFYAFSRGEMELEGENIVKCGEKLFRISELRKLIRGAKT